MLGSGTTIVVDIGKTLSKVTLWDRAGRLLDRVERPNAGCTVDGLRRLDIDGIGAWLVESLGRFAGHPVEAIVPVGHGAGVVALGADGPLFAPLDYEQPLPAEVMTAYRAERDPFAHTGSPALPDGLNLGSQLFWLDLLHPDAMTRATLVPWAQYWAWFLSGEAVSEVTSLGCHSDLWLPAEGRFSPLAQRLGWAARFAPLAAAGDTIGTLRPALAAQTGLPESVRVLAGLHDSNAALLAARGFAAMAQGDATLLSTGTWFVGMRLPAGPVDLAALPGERDCLVNVDVAGRSVPSARFMGGREVELLGDRIDLPGTDGLADALIDTAMVLPAQVRGCGPFPDRIGRWINRPADPQARAAAIALYAALMTDASLDLIGARGTLLIEGRFARGELFTRALATLRPDMAVHAAAAEADVAFGALRLLWPDLPPPGALARVEPLDRDLFAYRDEWYDDMDAFA